MGIWIRSKDRNILVCAKVISVEYFGIKEIQKYIIYADCENVGDYSSKDKAIKVLDMIQEHITNHTERFPFEMPQDDEV